MVSRFNGLSAREKPLKRFFRLPLLFTGLKPGANERVQETEMRSKCSLGLVSACFLEYC